MWNITLVLVGAGHGGLFFNQDTNFKLTVQGKRAYDCISGGALLTGIGFIANLSPLQIVAALQPLSKLSGCDGVVDWTELNTASNALSFLNILKLR
jgi:hypothetical protein